MADYLVTDTALTAIANAIRSAGGITGSLSFPDGFILAINNIPSGGGGGGDVEVVWEVMVNQDVTVMAGSPTPNYFIVNNYDEPISAHETYRVTWGPNNTEYICQTDVAAQGQTQDGYFFGNVGIVGGTDTGEPFLMYRTSATRFTCATNQAAGVIHVKVERLVSSEE